MTIIRILAFIGAVAVVLAAGCVTVWIVELTTEQGEQCKICGKGHLTMLCPHANEVRADKPNAPAEGELKPCPALDVITSGEALSGYEFEAMTVQCHKCRNRRACPDCAELEPIQWQAIMDALDYTDHNCGVVSDAHLVAKVRVAMILEALSKKGDSRTVAAGGTEN